MRRTLIETTGGGGGGDYLEWPIMSAINATYSGRMKWIHYRIKKSNKN